MKGNKRTTTKRLVLVREGEMFMEMPTYLVIPEG